MRKVSPSLMVFSVDVDLQVGVLLLFVQVQYLKCFPNDKYLLLHWGHRILFFEEALVIDDIFGNIKEDYLR